MDIINRIICLVGIDGSGKTTLSKLLVKKLNYNGVRSRYIYGRFLPTLTKPFFFISKFFFNAPNSHHKNLYEPRYKNFFLRYSYLSKLYIIIILIDQFFQLIIKYYIPSLFKQEVIVFDRSLIDTVIMDIAQPCGFSNNQILVILQRYHYLFPKIDFLFFLDVPPQIAYHRKNDITNIQKLVLVKNTYTNVTKKLGGIRIDGTINLNDSIKKIITELNLNLSNKKNLRL